MSVNKAAAATSACEQMRSLMPPGAATRAWVDRAKRGYCAWATKMMRVVTRVANAVIRLVLKAPPAERSKVKTTAECPCALTVGTSKRVRNVTATMPARRGLNVRQPDADGPVPERAPETQIVVTNKSAPK